MGGPSTQEERLGAAHGGDLVQRDVREPRGARGGVQPADPETEPQARFGSCRTAGSVMNHTWREGSSDLLTPPGFFIRF